MRRPRSLHRRRAYRTTNGADALHGALPIFSITVTEVNDPPVASDDIRGPVAEDGSLGFSAAGLTVNDSAGPTNERSRRPRVTAAATTAATHATTARTDKTATSTPPPIYNSA